jgi:5'-nucleotidase
MLLLTACGATDANVAKPLPAQSRTFPATGFTVENEFLYFFDRYGGVESLGQPISGELNDGGWRVQYFEIGRLEYHPENAPEYRVTVGWLGDLLQRRQPPLAASSIPPVDAPNRRYFAKTGHTLNGDFLRYFDTNGGSVRFGLPISEPFLLEGQLTQDFQSARFFWTPAAESPVTLEAIGQTHLQQIQKNRPPE